MRDELSLTDSRRRRERIERGSRHLVQCGRFIVGGQRLNIHTDLDPHHHMPNDNVIGMDAQGEESAERQGDGQPQQQRLLFCTRIEKRHIVLLVCA